MHRQIDDVGCGVSPCCKERKKLSHELGQCVLLGILFVLKGEKVALVQLCQYVFFCLFLCLDFLNLIFYNLPRYPLQQLILSLQLTTLFG